MGDRSSLCRFPLFAGLCLALLLSNDPAAADIDEVRHQPAQPKSKGAVLVTARLGDAKNVVAVELLLQTLAPGKYIRKSDPAYEKK